MQGAGVSEFASDFAGGAPGFAGAIWRTRFSVLLVRLCGAMTKILCVEPDLAVRETRCAVLKCSGWDATSASPQVAEIVLRGQRFDLLVVSALNDRDLHRVINLSDGAEVLVLEELTTPSELLSLVAEKLSGQRRA